MPNVMDKIKNKITNTNCSIDDCKFHSCGAWEPTLCDKHKKTCVYLTKCIKHNKEILHKDRSIKE